MPKQALSRLSLLASIEPGSLPRNSMIKMRCPDGQLILMAGPVGIEPTLRVLETLVLPLYDGPALRS